MNNNKKEALSKREARRVAAKERIDAAATLRGIIRIGDFINTGTNTRWRCTEGHEWEANPNKIQQGQGCPYCSGRIGAKERIDASAALRGIIRIGEYINTTTKTRWRCAEGHEWDTVPGSIQQGTGCPHCLGLHDAKERIDAAAALRGITRIGDYINANTKTRWRCTKEHEWSAVPGSIQQGSGCPHCLGFHDAKERTDAAAALREITRIGEYLTARTKTRWRCTEGHEWITVPSSIQRGSGCPYCLGLHDVQERIDADAAIRGITRIGEYVNTRTKTLWRCAEGHEWEAAPGNIKQGKSCPHCIGRYDGKERIDASVAERGITRVGEYINARTKTRWRCAEGHEWEAVPTDVQQGNSCPHCSGRAGAIERTDAVAAERGIVRIGEYFGAMVKTRWRCAEGHEWESMPNSIQQGRGCPSCSQYGYQPDKPGTLYILISECGGRIKIGITSNYQERFKQLSVATPFDFSPIQIHTDNNGAVAQTIEREAHKMLEPYNARLTGFSGATEWFHSTRQVLEFIALL